MPPTLREQFQPAQKRAQLIDDAVALLDAEVGDKSGLGGIAVKAAFSVLKATGGSFIRKAIDKLFDDFVAALEDPYARATGAGLTPGGLIEREKTQVAASLLRVADDKVKGANNTTVQKAYEKLRPAAQKHVEAAAPRIAALLDRHAAR